MQLILLQGSHDENAIEKETPPLFPMFQDLRSISLPRIGFKGEPRSRLLHSGWSVFVSLM
ncbi:hypothetical protein IGI04_007739 [Brassica rapa subsp. trilocularis]|uniref:Uncharacterized protein n=1 Tax=Brassica rapa subsp. trilocularis TaxID=1813537 RepID=A0ABQ7NKR8_BRACM|nr:hypothetical protein IGI04_007739 [Brassica rapa subsp. trilocularis]